MENLNEKSLELSDDMREILEVIISALKTLDEGKYNTADVMAALNMVAVSAWGYSQ